MSQLNKVRFQQFLRQSKGLRLRELHVNRQEKQKKVILKYNGVAEKGKQRLTGEWAVDKVDRDEAAITADIKAFLVMARQHFFVHRGQGLEEEIYADETMEAKATPIVGKSEGDD